MNHREHFHPLKIVAYFQPSLLKNCLIYQSMIFGIKVDNLQLIPLTLPLLVM